MRVFILCLLITLNLMALETRMPLHNEIKEIAEVYYRSWHDTFGSLAPHLSKVRTGEHCFKKWDQYYQKGNGHFILIAVLNKKIVGVAYAGPLKTKVAGMHDCYDSEVDKLYVLPEYKNQGIGSRLFTKVCDKLSDQGFKGTIVQSLIANKNANNFYQKKGGVLLNLRANFNDKMNVYGFKFS